MRDYKYTELLTEDPVMDAHVAFKTKKLKSECLIPIVEAFSANLVRIGTFSFMPAQVSFMVRRDQLLSDCAVLKVIGKLDPDWRKLIEGNLPKEYEQEFKRLSDEFRTSSSSDKSDPEITALIGINYIEALLGFSKGMQQSMEAVLSAIVLESWTAFECLASDMWVAAVGNGPGELRARLLASNKLLKPDDNIGPKELYQIDFDPSTNFGLALRELGRVSFQRLEYIKRFYAVAFDNDFDQMFKSTENGYIFALSAFRNTLIHNSGRADKKFVKQVKDFSAFASINAGDVLLLDGELVKKLRAAAASLGEKLIAYVDAALAVSP